MAKTTKKTTTKKTAAKAAGSTSTPVKKKTAAKKAAGKKTASKQAPVKKVAARKAAPKKKASAGARRVNGTSNRRSITASEHRQMIAEAAYLRGESQGFLTDEREDWLLAEAEINVRLLKAQIDVVG